MQYAYSTDEESYSGLCDSEEEAVREGFSENADADTIYVGECVHPDASGHLEADLLLDHIACQDDFQGGWAEDAFTSVSKEAKQVLTERLQKLFEEWMDEFKERPTFYTVRNSKEWSLSEAAAKGWTEPLAE